MKSILLVMLLACGTAQASEWVSLGKTLDGKTEILVDVSSVKVAGQIRRAWSKMVVAPHTQMLEQKWVSSVLILKAFDCAEKTVRFEATTTYYDDGSNHYVPAAAFPTPWEPVAPETMDDNQMELLCAWKPSDTPQTPQWVPVSTNKAGTEEQDVDVSSIQVTDDTRRAWVKTLVSPHSKHGVGKYSTKWIAYDLARMAFNCGEEAFRVEDMYIYLDDGTVDPALSATPDPWGRVPPDSVVATLMRFICGWKLK